MFNVRGGWRSATAIAAAAVDRLIMMLSTREHTSHQAHLGLRWHSDARVQHLCRWLQVAIPATAAARATRDRETVIAILVSGLVVALSVAWSPHKQSQIGTDRVFFLDMLDIQQRKIAVHSRRDLDAPKLKILYGLPLTLFCDEDNTPAKTAARLMEWASWRWLWGILNWNKEISLFCFASLFVCDWCNATCATCSQVIILREHDFLLCGCTDGARPGSRRRNNFVLLNGVFFCCWC